MAVYKDKNGTWYVSARYTNWKGEADRKLKRGFQTKKEATEWERNFFLENAGNLEMTFEAFYELYKKNMQDRIKLSTWKMKESVIESKILPYFRKKRMCDIKPRDVVTWQNTMLKMRDDDGNPYSPVYLTEIQQAMVQELSERAAKVHAGIVDPATDNMLKITSDGRKLGLDQRVINPNLPDEPTSKVNMCVDNIFRIWDEGHEDKLTQLVFCDLSTPKAAPSKRAAKAAAGNLDSPELHVLEILAEKDGTPDDTNFTVYDDIREKLVARGIPREQIAFIHEANTEARKKELFSKVRSGQVRVLMGSTFKMGAGMNVQDRLVALHDLDAPWRPGDLEQRSGRIIRQGNMNPEVHIFRYVTEATFDAYLWQTLENKQKFISQIMTSKSPVRACDDIDETALS